MPHPNHYVRPRVTRKSLATLRQTHETHGTLTRNGKAEKSSALRGESDDESMRGEYEDGSRIRREMGPAHDSGRRWRWRAVPWSPMDARVIQKPCDRRRDESRLLPIRSPTSREAITGKRVTPDAAQRHNHAPSHWPARRRRKPTGASLPRGPPPRRKPPVQCLRPTDFALMLLIYGDPSQCVGSNGMVAVTPMQPMYVHWVPSRQRMNTERDVTSAEYQRCTALSARRQAKLRRE